MTIAKTAGTALILMLSSFYPSTAVANSGHCVASTRPVCNLLDQAQNNQNLKEQLLSEALVQIELGTGKALPDSEELVDWLQARWMYHLVRDEHLTGIRALEQASAILLHLPSSEKRLTQIYNNISYSHNALGNVTLARANQRAAIQIALEKELDTLPDLYYALGESYRRTNESKVAATYFKAALTLFEENADTFGTAIATNKLGTMARTSGNVQQAIALHTKAGVLFGPEQDYRQLVTQIELARDHLAASDWQRAADYALTLWMDNRLLAAQKIDAGMLLLEILGSGQTCSYSYLTSSGIDPDQLLVELEILFKGDSNDTNARTYPLRQLDLFEKATRFFLTQNNLVRVSEYGDRGLAASNRLARELKGRNENYFALLEKSQTLLTSYVEALYVSDRSRIPDLLDKRYDWRHIGSSAQLSKTVAGNTETQEIKRFNDLVQAEQDLISFNSSTNNPARNALTSERESFELEKLEHTLARARDLFLASRSTGHEVPAQVRIDPVEAPLTPVNIAKSDIVLRYFIQDDVSFVVVQTHDKTWFIDLPQRQRVRQLVAQVVDKLKNRNESGQRRFQALAEAGALVPLKTILAQEGIERIVIVTDDSIHSLPFAAVNTSIASASNRYQPLGSAFQILRTHSVTRYYAKQLPIEERQPASVDIAIFADPDINRLPSIAHEEETRSIQSWTSQLDPLPYTAKEAGHIKDTFSNSSVLTYIGERATTAALLSDEVRHSKVLHIATHGYFDESTPDIVGLLTATDRTSGSDNNLFSISSLLGEKYTSNLVIISGCETMRGKEIGGLGAKSMGQLFLSSGARSAIGTLWKIPDQGSAHFMRLFHFELNKNNGNASLALKNTRAQMATSLRYADPAYWATFVLDSTQYETDQDVFAKR